MLYDRIFIRFLHITWFLCTTYGRRTVRNIPFHCNRVSTTIGKLERRNLNSDEITMSTKVEANLGIGQTACFHLYFGVNDTQESVSPKEASKYNGSLLYSFTLERLQHFHPIRSRYVFAIPKINTKCICDCPGGKDHCSGGVRYRNCSGPDLCYNTYHPHQPAIGCPTNGEADICCEIRISRDETNPLFHAFYLGQPTPQVTLSYRLYRVKARKSVSKRKRLHKRPRRVQKKRYFILEAKQLRLPMNRDQELDLSDQHLKIYVQGPGDLRHLGERTYFASVTGARSPILTNHGINDRNSFSMYRLGWFRQVGQSKDWQIRNGPIKIQNAHHVSAVDCQKQRFKHLYDAEFYATDQSPWKGSIGVLVRDYYPWIQSAFYRPRVNDRIVKVDYKSSPNVQITMELEGSPERVLIGHHHSTLGGFDGAIWLDRHSNRFLNITFWNAKGTLIGTIYKTRRRRVVEAVATATLGAKTVNRKEYETAILELPSAVNGSRWVCFYPANRPSQEQCRWAEYHSEPLHWYVVPNSWNEGEGSCPGCNKLSAANVFKYFNPSAWFDGLRNAPKFLGMALEIGIGIVVFMVTCCVCRRCVWPIFRWSIFGGGRRRAYQPTEVHKI